MTTETMEKINNVIGVAIMIILFVFLLTFFGVTIAVVAKETGVLFGCEGVIMLANML